MRRELDDVKTAVGALGAQMNAMQADLGEVKRLARNTAIIVSGHPENFARIEKKLSKLDEFDGLKNSLDVLVSEIISSRHDRTLRDKSFSDQQETLTDHELRLTRIELRSKDS